LSPFLFDVALDGSFDAVFDLSLDASREPVFDSADLFGLADDDDPRLLAFAVRLDSDATGRATSRERFAATAGVPPPGTLTTTSSLFARCST